MVIIYQSHSNPMFIEGIVISAKHGQLLVLYILPNNKHSVEFNVQLVGSIGDESILEIQLSLFDEGIECLFNNHLMIRKIEYI